MNIPTRLVAAAARALFICDGGSPDFWPQLDEFSRHGFADMAREVLAAVFAECEVREEVRASLRWLVITTPPWEGEGE